MDLHQKINDFLESEEENSSSFTTGTVAVPSTSTTSHVPQKKSLFEDYYNSDLNDSNIGFDEVETYIGIKVPKVCERNNNK